MRWHLVFGQSTDPLFLLNARRRLLYVNPAWERWAGLAFTEVRGRACRRRGPGTPVGPEAILHALAPPAEVLQGRLAQVQRRVGSRWCEIVFLPWQENNEPHAILGRIRLLEELGPLHQSQAPLTERLVQLRHQHHLIHTLDHLPADTPWGLKLRQQVLIAANHQGPLVLEGPVGSGKEWLARTAHRLSPRREKFFACLDAALVSPTALADLWESWAKSAEIGTVLIKQPGLLPREWQHRLVEGGSSPVLWLSSRDPLESLLQAGKLLPELWARFSPLTIQVPALKNRPGELAFFCEQFLKRSEQKQRSLAPEALTVLEMHDWPGNLRELQQVLKDTGEGERIEPSHLPYYLRSEPVSPPRPIALDGILEQVERRLLLQALQQTGYNKSRAAELLSIYRTRLLRRMEQLNIPDQPGEGD